MPEGLCGRYAYLYVGIVETFPQGRDNLSGAEFSQCPDPFFPHPDIPVSDSFQEIFDSPSVRYFPQDIDDISHHIPSLVIKPPRDCLDIFPSKYDEGLYDIFSRANRLKLTEILNQGLYGILFQIQEKSLTKTGIFPLLVRNLFQNLTS